MTRNEYHFAIFLTIGFTLGQMAFGDGYTEPRIEPEPGHSGPPLLLHCESDPGRTFRHEHQRRGECRNHERRPDKPREVECSMNDWSPGVMIARGKPQKDCA